MRTLTGIFSLYYKVIDLGYACYLKESESSVKVTVFVPVQLPFRVLP